MQKRKRIYYSAGLISIILLPIFCLISIKNSNPFRNSNSIGFQSMGGQEDTELFKSYTAFLNTKKFTTVALTGNNFSDSIKLEEAQNDIKELVKSKDSVAGIKFHFGQKSKYWTFIRALDILYVEQCYTFFVYKDDIWATNPKPPKPIKFDKNAEPLRIITCGSGGSDPDFEEDIWGPIWQKTSEIGKKYYLPIIAYILMLFYTFRRIGKRVKVI
ncbi:hypothetical protein [Flavobacterium piscis]|uniref:TPM domain-containing protein n=1 Tax=Flavobacterium piscis TaxID=1114874 RepID=A0ABU1Y4K1_9FLAO|nr:hypothetical protein [Flavobacterium piscis]MDR7209145.1 hypothetical protein [Flavobacterium piscis]